MEPMYIYETPSRLKQWQQDYACHNATRASQKHDIKHNCQQEEQQHIYLIAFALALLLTLLSAVAVFGQTSQQKSLVYKAFSREIRGVHYPSDSEAGREFASQFVAQLIKSKKFKSDLTAMKAEIGRVRNQHLATLQK